MGDEFVAWVLVWPGKQIKIENGIKLAGAPLMVQARLCRRRICNCFLEPADNILYSAQDAECEPVFANILRIRGERVHVVIPQHQK